MTQTTRMAARRERAPPSEFVRTTPASPDPARHPFHAAARACTGGRLAARPIGRDWLHATGSAIGGATRTAGLLRQGDRRTGLPLGIPSALQRAWRGRATRR